MPFFLTARDDYIDTLNRSFEAAESLRDCASDQEIASAWCDALAACAASMHTTDQTPVAHGMLNWENRKNIQFDHGQRLARSALSVSQQRLIATQAYAAFRSWHGKTGSPENQAELGMHWVNASGTVGHPDTPVEGACEWDRVPAYVLLGASLGWMWWALDHSTASARAAVDWASAPDALAGDWSLANLQSHGMSASIPSPRSLYTGLRGNRATVECLFFAQALRTGDVITTHKLAQSGARVSAGGTQNSDIMTALILMPSERIGSFNRLFALAQMNGLNAQWMDFVYALQSSASILGIDPKSSVSTGFSWELQAPVALALAMALHPSAADLQEMDRHVPEFSVQWKACHEREALEHALAAAKSEKDGSGSSLPLKGPAKTTKRL